MTSIQRNDVLDSLFQLLPEPEKKETAPTDFLPFLAHVSEMQKESSLAEIFSGRICAENEKWMSSTYYDRFLSALETLSNSGDHALRTTAKDVGEVIASRRGDLVMSPFDFVPNEVLYQIFEKIESAEDAANVACVSQRFYSVMTDINQTRVLVRGAEDALGDILENVQPKTEVLNRVAFDLVKLIGSLDKSSKAWKNKRARIILGRYLRKIETFPESVHNHLLQTFLQQVLATGSQETFKFCLSFFYAKSCVAQKLHLARAANREPLTPFKDFNAFISGLNPKVVAHSEGFQLAEDSPFSRSVVDGDVRSYLSVSPSHQFKEGELVVISHTGNLTPGRRRLMYGVVKQVVQDGDKPAKYKVYTHLHVRDDKKTWIDSATLQSHMIAKIENNPTTEYELKRKFKLS